MCSHRLWPVQNLDGPQGRGYSGHHSQVNKHEFYGASVPDANALTRIFFYPVVARVSRAGDAAGRAACLYSPVVARVSRARLAAGTAASTVLWWQKRAACGNCSRHGRLYSPVVARVSRARLAAGTAASTVRTLGAID